MIRSTLTGSNHAPFQSIDQHLCDFRRVNAGSFIVFALGRFANQIKLTDAQLQHPLIRTYEDLAGGRFSSVSVNILG